MLHIKKYLFTLSLLLVSQFLAAQEILSLDSVLNIIQQKNPELKMYEQQIKSQDALVSGASTWMAPMLGVGTFMTPYNNFSRAGNQQDGSFMLTAEQKIPSKGKIKANEAYLQAQSEITAQIKSDSFNELRAMARSFYYEALTEQMKLAYFSKNLQILQNLKKLAEIRYTYNKAGLAQIYTMEAKLFVIQNKITATKARIEIGKIKLNTLMNRPQELDFEIDTTRNFNTINSTDDLIDLVNNRSKIKMVDAQLKSLSLENKMIAAEAKPEFSIQFNHMITYNNLMPNQFSLMGGISIPIAPWSAKSYKSKLKANQFDASAMEYQKENWISNLSGMIKTQEEHLKHMKMELGIYETKILPSLQKSYDVTLFNYQENTEELPEVLNSWKETNDSQIDYLMLLNEYYQTLAEYEKNVER